MTYCTTDELVALTGSTLATDILRAIIKNGDREINGYLAQYGVGADASACKSASLELAIAGLLVRGQLDDTRPDTFAEGDYSQHINIDISVAAHRKAAFSILDRYVSATSVASSSVSKYYVAKVNR